MTNITSKFGTAQNSTPADVSAMITRDNALAEQGEVLGQYKPYNSQIELPEIAGTRTVKVLYRNDPKLPAKDQKQSVYVRIPSGHITEQVVAANIAELAPHVVTWLQGLEDAAIKEEHKSGLLSVYTEKLTLAALIEALESAPENAGRLTKEKVETWFGEVIEGNLALLFADKLGIDVAAAGEAELVKLSAVLNAYKGKFAALASPKVFIKPEERAAMIKVINECGAAEDSLGARFILRLEKMDTKQEEVLLCL